MGRRLALALASLALAACADGEGAGTTSAGSGTSASTTAAQSTSEGSTGTSTTATGGAASTTQATTTSTTTTTSTATATTSTSTASTASASASATQTSDPATTSSTGDDTSGGTGGDGPCVDLGDVDFGACDAIVGYVHDGQGCVLRSGCGCEPHCDAVFPSAQACALACAGAGACDLAKMKAAGIAAEPFVTGDFCDGVYVCGGDEAELAALFPGQPHEAQGAYPCEGTSMTTAHNQGEVDASEWQRLCAASLLPGVSAIYCTIWGP